MASDELTKPLGLSGRRAMSGRRRIATFVTGLAAGLVALAAAWLVLGPGLDDPAVVALDGASTPATATLRPEGSAGPQSPADGTGLIEAVPDGGLSEVGADTIIISDPDALGPIRLAAAPIEELAEDSPHGLLPRIGPDGTRPMDAYARPVGPDGGGARRIAIVVGGLGIAEDGTDAAIDDLPGAVTLAFAPYGKNLARLLSRARDGGHEILLQVPLEPYGYPNNDPGPHTLTVAASADENRDRLHWLMSRVTTYVGVMNYLGARFTSDEAALEPVIAEIGERGLLYFDDGSSGASRADQLAANRTPFARADVVLDADTDAKSIDAHLAEIEAIARRRGHAIASASAFPVTIARIAEFARAAARRGIEIVPLTALVGMDRK